MKQPRSPFVIHFCTFSEVNCTSFVILAGNESIGARVLYLRNKLEIGGKSSCHTRQPLLISHWHVSRQKAINTSVDDIFHKATKLNRGASFSFV